MHVHALANLTEAMHWAAASRSTQACLYVQCTLRRLRVGSERLNFNFRRTLYGDKIRPIMILEKFLHQYWYKFYIDHINECSLARNKQLTNNFNCIEIY